MIESVHKMVAFLIILKLSDCDQMEPFVVGGNHARIQEFPHSAFLVVECDDSWICGSSVLNQRLLLTAAHCLHGCRYNFRIDAYAGDANLNRVKIIKRVTKLTIHKDYDPRTIENDIGLVYLQKTLPLGRYIKRVIVRPVFPLDVKEAMVAGWGVVNDETAKLRPYLKSVRQEVWRYPKCAKQVTMKPGMMCAMSVIHDHRPSQGDSGSALVTATKEQIGLVSFRRKNRNLIIYTNVTYFYSWIQSAANLLHCRN